MWRLGPRHDAMSRFLSDQNLDSDDISNDTSWLFVYTTCLFISFLATLVAGTHIRKLGGGDEFRSAVRFVTTTFLMCTSVHALLGGLFYSYMIVTMDDWIDKVKDFRDKWDEKHRPPPRGSNGSAGSSSYDQYTPPSWAMVFDQSSSGAVDGPELLIRPDDKNDGGEAAYLSKVSHDYMKLPTGVVVLLCLESIFFMLSAYWIFLLTRELYKLAKTTHDRGVDEERRHIRMYALGGLAILVGFLLSGVFVIVFVSGNFSYRAISMIEFSATIASILYSCGSLLKLRATGRKNEHIHGMLMASPLYRRLKMVMIVCIVFTLPYSIMQLGLAIVQDDAIDDVPDYIVGVITTLYYLFGAAQALVMGASQQCCLRILHPLIPAHVRNSPEWRAMQGSRRHESMNGIHDVVDAPAKPVFVNTDIESSSALWAQAPQHVIDEAQRIHDDLLRSTLPKFRGYEITTAGDAFQLAFHTIGDAVDYCLEVQQQLIQAKWPSEIDGLVPSTKTEREFGLKCNAIFKGLRVRMGVHDTNEAEEGSLITQKHPVTGKTLYIGGSEMIAREVGDMGYGGQVVISKRVAAWLRSNEDKIRTPFVVDYYGSHAFCALDLEVELYTVTPKVLDGRRKVFRKRREAEKKNGPLPVSSSPASRTASTESSGDTGGDDSATDFRAQRSPERKVWTIV